MKKEFEKARRETMEFIKANGIKHHMFYGPVSDEYWQQNYKILFVNEEPYGYEDCGIVNINRDALLDWFYDAGNTGTKTVR